MTDKIPRRITPQRQLILEALRKADYHPTALELFEIARRRLPRLSLATVYRNLELLVANGTVRRLELGGTQARFDWDPAPHYHVRCVDCGRVDDLHGLLIELPARGSETADGYELLSHRLEFAGVCPKCRGHREQSRPRGCSI
jgi:Fur family ferric uptake transcriptional regulator